MHCPQPKIISIHDDQPEYQVEDIIGRKNFKNGLKYLVKWKGYDIKQSTWQPINNLRNSIQFVKQYERRYKEQNQQMKNRIDMSFDDDAHESQAVKKKKRIFKEHLVFPKSSNTSIKKQEQKKIKKNVVNKKQNTQNQSSKNYKFNTFDLGESVDNFCIQVSEIQTPLQINNQLQQKMQQQIVQGQKQDKIQGQAQSQSNQQKADQQQLPPSLNLTQYQNQQDYRIALQHLNPHSNNINRPANSQTHKKLMRVQTPLSKLKIIGPEYIGKDYKISKIVNSQGKWFVQIKINEIIIGYISAQLMKQINISAMLDYLYNINPLS